ncbi:hypothetical protein A2Z56_03880 [Candidatus Kaiserbacteria bacterium RIFCSPHIGHO2_12_45_16]|nr:MAG: hypothetical protein A2Z56_03880 [Candidatus Kaiserbacteria bacterium RIFCSPHIGHO2_12_45_16]
MQKVWKLCILKVAVVPSKHPFFTQLKEMAMLTPEDKETLRLVALALWELGRGTKPNLPLADLLTKLYGMWPRVPFDLQPELTQAKTKLAYYISIAEIDEEDAALAAKRARVERGAPTPSSSIGLSRIIREKIGA